METFAQSTLIKQLEDQKHALDHAAIVGVTDRNGVIVYVNDQFCKTSEYSREELIGSTYRIVNSGYHPRSFFIDLWKTIGSGNVWHGEIKNKKKSGHFYWVKTTIVPFLDTNGRPYQYLSIRQDVTELKEAQQIILEQQAKLVSTSKLSALGELSAALTHEINNPLAVILGRTEMLRNLLASENPDLKTARAMMESIEITGRRIEKIMGTVRALAHGGEAEPLQKITLQALIENSLDMVRSRMKNHGIQMRIKLHNPELPVICRPTEIFQIVLNLLNNAHDAARNQQPSWVEIQSETHENGIIISVLDSGPGVPSEVLPKLFQPFFTTKEIGVGTGLGLTISNSLAHRNGGRLYHDSTSANTRFCLALPLHGPEKPIG
ncbi:MAG: PAS domain-containing sensor histidine kinase [Pseudobdellovibrionaceae bacterium]